MNPAPSSGHLIGRRGGAKILICSILAYAGSILPCTDSLADTGYWKVVDFSGEYHVEGSSVTTGERATVDILLNRSRENMIHLSKNSQLDFLRQSPLEMRLKKGGLFVLLEAEGEPLKIISGHSQVMLSQGGLVIETNADKDRVRVFSETIQITPRAAPGDAPVFRDLSEGWELRISSGGGIEGPKRMDYGDYSDWQRWFKENYERNDRSRLKSDA